MFHIKTFYVHVSFSKETKYTTEEEAVGAW